LRLLVGEIARIDQGAISRGRAPVEPIADLAVGRDAGLGEMGVVAQRGTANLGIEERGDAIAAAKCLRDHFLELLVLGTGNEKFRLDRTHARTPWRGRGAVMKGKGGGAGRR